MLDTEDLSLPARSMRLILLTRLWSSPSIVCKQHSLSNHFQFHYLIYIHVHVHKPSTILSIYMYIIYIHAHVHKHQTDYIKALFDAYSDIKQILFTAKLISTNFTPKSTCCLYNYTCIKKSHLYALIHVNVIIHIPYLCLCQDHGEDGVRPAAAVVHTRSSSRPEPVTKCQPLLRMKK